MLLTDHVDSGHSSARPSKASRPQIARDSSDQAGSDMVRRPQCRLDDKLHTMLATAGFCINLSSPPLAIIC